MPAIQTIKKRFPGHRFVLLTDNYAGAGKNRVSSWDVLGPTGWFDEVIFYTPAAKRYFALREAAKNGFLLLRRIRELSPEHIFNLSPERRTWQARRDIFYFKHLAGRGAHYHGPQRPGRYRLFHREGGPCKSASSCEPEWKTLLGIAGGDESVPGFRLAIPEDERSLFLKLADAKGLFLASQGEDRLLAVGPGSKMSAKRWPTRSFCELGKLLLKKFQGLHLLVLGGKEDQETGNELCRAWGGRAHNFAGELSVYGSAAALERCEGFIGNDSGTMHLAAMAGVPCVALFSARDRPGKWAPYGDNHVILRHATLCAGCMLEECGTHQGLCLRMITTAQVFEAARKMLTAKEHKRT